MRRGWIGGMLVFFLILGAMLAVLGGGVVAYFLAFAPEHPLLHRILPSYLAVMGGVLLLGILGLLGSAIEALLRAPQTPAPGEIADNAVSQKSAPVLTESELPTLFEQVKTYVDLEMWELAYDKARQVMRLHPNSHEADVLSRNINELRWKAEPKFVTQPEVKISNDDEKLLLGRGLDQMLDHVKTYMELEMWELARQKALAIMKNFPESPQSDDIARLFPEIDAKFQAQQRTGAPAPAAKPEEKKGTQK